MQEEEPEVCGTWLAGGDRRTRCWGHPSALLSAGSHRAPRHPVQSAMDYIAKAKLVV